MIRVRMLCGFDKPVSRLVEPQVRTRADALVDPSPQRAAISQDRKRAFGPSRKRRDGTTKPSLKGTHLWRRRLSGSRPQSDDTRSLDCEAATERGPCPGHAEKHPPSHLETADAIHAACKALIEASWLVMSARGGFQQKPRGVYPVSVRIMELLS
jgi:hypothetical protein